MSADDKKNLYWDGIKNSRRVNEYEISIKTCTKVPSFILNGKNEVETCVIKCNIFNPENIVDFVKVKAFLKEQIEGKEMLLEDVLELSFEALVLLYGKCDNIIVQVLSEGDHFFSVVLKKVLKNEKK